MTDCVAAHGCITCGDVAVSMRVLKVDHDRGLALCSDEHDRHESVEIALVEPVTAHELLLVHAGTALGRAGQDASTEQTAAAQDASTRDAGPLGAEQRELGVTR